MARPITLEPEASIARDAADASLSRRAAENLSGWRVPPAGHRPPYGAIRLPNLFRLFLLGKYRRGAPKPVPVSARAPRLPGLPQPVGPAVLRCSLQNAA